MKSAASVACLGTLLLVAAGAGAGNVLPNGGFEWIESARDGTVLPRTWETERHGDGRFSVVEDRDKVHSGKRALGLSAGTGRAIVRYSAIPLADAATAHRSRVPNGAPSDTKYGSLVVQSGNTVSVPAASGDPDHEQNALSGPGCVGDGGQCRSGPDHG